MNNNKVRIAAGAGAAVLTGGIIGGVYHYNTKPLTLTEQIAADKLNLQNIQEVSFTSESDKAAAAKELELLENLESSEELNKLSDIVASFQEGTNQSGQTLEEAVMAVKFGEELDAFEAKLGQESTLNTTKENVNHYITINDRYHPQKENSELAKMSTKLPLLLTVAPLAGMGALIATQQWDLYFNTLASVFFLNNIVWSSWMTASALLGLRKMHKDLKEKNWLVECKEILGMEVTESERSMGSHGGDKQTGWAHSLKRSDISIKEHTGLLHFFMCPNYKEDFLCMSETLERAANSSLAKEFVIPVMAMEAREGEAGVKKAEDLKAMWKPFFKDFIITYHTLDKSKEELVGKASNTAHAYKVVKKYYDEVFLAELKANNYVEDQTKVIFSIADSDSCFHDRWFEGLTVGCLEEKDVKKRSWMCYQPPIIHTRNINVT